MSITNYAGIAQRTAAVAAPAKKVPVAPHLLPNVAGQVGAVGVKSGIVNSQMSKRK